MRISWRVVFCLAIGSACNLAAQIWDNSGNSKLSGQYYFREVFYVVGDDYGDIGRAVALFGSITFSGTGTYTLAGTVVDSAAGTRPYTIQNGTYTISASGYGFLSNPYSSGDLIYGLVSNGTFIGSSTENGLFNDLFVATASAGATNATFQGSYSLAYMSFPFNNFNYADPFDAYDALGQLNADGNGGIGTVTLTAYQGDSASPIHLSETGVRYALSSFGIMSFPTSGNLAIAGNQYFFISADGNFIFGGSGSYWDMFVGVRTASNSLSGLNAQSTLNGLYYQAGLNEDNSQVNAANPYATLTTNYGSLYADPATGTILGHQRYFEPVVQGPQDFTYRDSVPLDPGTGYTDTSGATTYALSPDRGIRIGLGIGPYLGISVAIRPPQFSGSGVFLNPTGVQNAASFGLFTAGLARGELLLLSGTNLADQFVVASGSSLPNSLGGVQVLINNVPAPIYYVSPTGIATVVPYGTTSAIAQIQVNNKGAMSNAITAFVRKTAPGVFGATGYAIAQRLPDYSLVTPANPAHSGDILLIYATGFGDVFPTIADGAPGPSSPTSSATNTIQAAIGGKAANIAFAGLVPTVPGQYVVILTVPDGVTSGDAAVGIAGPDSVTSESLLPIAAAGASALVR